MPVSKIAKYKASKNIKTFVRNKGKLTRDEIFCLLGLAVQLNEFVRKITIHPNLVLILGSNEILSMTKEILTQSARNLDFKQLLSYDTTFNMGDFYLSTFCC